MLICDADRDLGRWAAELRPAQLVREHSLYPVQVAYQHGAAMGRLESLVSNERKSGISGVPVYTAKGNLLEQTPNGTTSSGST